MSAPDKENGDVVDNKVNPPPHSQRKPRLNRRGFHLTNHPIMKLLSDKSDQKTSSVNGLEKTEDKIKTDPFQKKIISLSSVKSKMSSSVKGSESSTTIKLKTSVNTGNENLLNTEVSSSSDSPPKKKHKPITWP